jgi:hypothetical protein
MYYCDDGVKGCFGFDSRKKSLVHAWIILEIMQFFYWIISLSLFLALSYILKLKSIRKSEVDEDEYEFKKAIKNDGSLSESQL